MGGGPPGSSAVGQQQAGLRMRPLSVSDLLDETVAIYKRQFVAFITLTGVVIVPIAVLGALMLVILTVVSSSLESGRLSPQAGAALGFGAFAVTLPVTLISLVGRMVAGVVAVKVAADVILGHPVDIWGSYRLVLGKIVPLSVASILVGTVTGAAVFCFPVAIYFAMSWGLIFPVIVLEHQGGVEAMRRSWQLMRGRRWQLLLCMIVIGLVAAVLIGIPAALFGVAAGAGVVFWGGRFNVDSGILAVQLAQVVLQTLGETLFLAFSYILITRFYFDARVRNEAYDLELRLDRLARA
jgi:hypothetical protein